MIGATSFRERLAHIFFEHDELYKLKEAQIKGFYVNIDDENPATRTGTLEVRLSENKQARCDILFSRNELQMPNLELIMYMQLYNRLCNNKRLLWRNDFGIINIYHISKKLDNIGIRSIYDEFCKYRPKNWTPTSNKAQAVFEKEA